MNGAGGVALERSEGLDYQARGESDVGQQLENVSSREVGQFEAGESME